MLARHGIDGEIHLDITRMSVCDSLLKFLKSEVICGRAHTKGFACKIHGIRAIADGGNHLFHIAGRR